MLETYVILFPFFYNTVMKEYVRIRCIPAACTRSCESVDDHSRAQPRLSCWLSTLESSRVLIIYSTDTISWSVSLVRWFSVIFLLTRRTSEDIYLRIRREKCTEHQRSQALSITEDLKHSAFRVTSSLKKRIMSPRTSCCYWYAVIITTRFVFVFAKSNGLVDNIAEKDLLALVKMRATCVEVNISYWEAEIE